MNPFPPRRALPGALFITLLALGPTALAEPPQRPGTPPASEPTTTSTKETFSNRATVEQKRAKQELERVRGTKAGALAPRLEQLIAEWALVVRENEETARLEADADRLEGELLELERRAEQAVLLLEQTDARRSQALTRLRELGLEETP